MKSFVGLALALASAGTAKGDGAGSNDASCCRALSHALRPIYHGPSSPDYDDLIKARWSGTAVLHPGCVVTPKSARDVSAIIKMVTKKQCRFAVKAGGHNANPGANSIDGGVSIDLGGLDSARLARDRASVTLGAGLSWGRAYDRFNSSRIGFPGGVCEDVGVGGPSLGGGQSLFQAKRGWAVDNILSYELVLASGDVVRASQTRHPDLFKALKGGNTNFGIVTHVEFAAFDLDDIWGGEVRVSLNGPQASRAEMLDRICHATVDFVRNNNNDLDTGLQVATAYLSGNKGQLVDLALSNTAGVENAKAARPFLKMPNQVSNAARRTKVADFVHEVSKFVPKGFRQVTASLTIANDYQTLREIWDATDKVYNDLPQKEKVDWIIQLIPQPKVQQSYAKKRGGNSLGLANVKEDQIVFWLASRWTDPSLDDMMEAARRKFIDVSEAVAKKHGTYSPFLYINFAAPSQEPLCGYGAESVAFLNKTAKKYDPHGVFQTLMPGGFKISKAKCARGGLSYV
ncbi:FAD binding domain-containing protein [Hirsutella rhossiliensis]